jgi:hypothetical protein
MKMLKYFFSNMIFYSKSTIFFICLNLIKCLITMHGSSFGFNHLQWVFFGTYGYFKSMKCSLRVNSFS